MIGQFVIDRVPIGFARMFGKSWSVPHLRIIYFHGIGNELVGRFSEILDHFGSMFDFVPYGMAMDALIKGQLSRPLMAVTFDDADRSVYENGLPVLRSRGIKACIFAVADYLAKGSTYREAQPRPVMSWREIQRCLEYGWEIGNHTFSHVNLVRCSHGEVLAEVEKNRFLLESHLHCPVEHFAYPYGQFTRQTIELLRKSGLCCTQATTRRGIMKAGHDVHFVRRDRIDLHRTPRQMETLMRLADRAYWVKDIARRLTSRQYVSQ